MHKGRVFDPNPALALHYIYENTTHDSPLRRLFIRVIMRELIELRAISGPGLLPSEYFMEDAAHYPRQALIDLMVSQILHANKCETASDPVVSDLEVPIPDT